MGSKTTVSLCFEPPGETGTLVLSCDRVGTFLWLVREVSCRFGIVRMMFSIPKGVTSLCFPALPDIFSLFLDGDVGDN